MSRLVTPGETSWIPCETNKVHAFQLSRPKLGVLFHLGSDEPLPPGEVSLIPAKAEAESRSFSAGATGGDGILVVGFEGGGPEESYSCRIEAEGADPYPLFQEKRLSVDKGPARPGPVVLAEAAPLFLCWDAGPKRKQERAPIKSRHVSIELPDGRFHLFETDVNGWLSLPSGKPRGEREQGVRVWLEVDPKAVRRLAVGKKPPASDGEAPPTELLQEVSVERTLDERGRPIFLARARRPAQLRIPIVLGPCPAKSNLQVCLDYTRRHVLWAKLDGEDLAVGTDIDPTTRTVTVIVRPEPGVHELTVGAGPAQAPGAAPAEPGDNVILYCRKIRIRA